MATMCKVGRLVPSKSVVFLCDMQEKFRQNIQYFPQIVNVASRMLKTARLLNIPVVVTEQYPKGLGPTVPELGLADYPDLSPISKTQFSMFTPEVQSLLRKEAPECKSVLLCGIETHVCIQGTCLALLEAGYEVHIVVDACSSRSMVDRLYGFERMKASGAWLTTSESAILCLLGDSAHPKFKEIQKVIMESAPDSGLLSLLPCKTT